MSRKNLKNDDLHSSIDFFQSEPFIIKITIHSFLQWLQYLDFVTKTTHKERART